MSIQSGWAVLCCRAVGCSEGGRRVDCVKEGDVCGSGEAPEQESGLMGLLSKRERLVALARRALSCCRVMR